MSSPVSTLTGDDLWRVCHTCIYPAHSACNEYWLWCQPPPGKKRRVLRSSWRCYHDCWHTVLLCASLVWSNISSSVIKGDELPHDGPHSKSSSSS